MRDPEGAEQLGVGEREMSPIWYLAGPMTGRPQFNYPAFINAATLLRTLGHTVISPAEQDPPEIREAAMRSANGDLADLADLGDSWGKALGRCVETVADHCTGIVFLPTWERSRGTRLEAMTGLLCGREFAYYDPSGVSGLYKLSARSVHDILKRNLP